MKNYRYVIIGNSAAGISAINKLWQLDPEGSVLCISREKEKPYNKCFLADYLAGEKSEEQLSTKLFHERVEFRFDTQAIEIDADRKIITMSDNETIIYQELLIATGSSPILPPISGLGAAKNVFTFHTLQDTNRLLSEIQHNDFSHVTIIGAGLSGLEAADALRSQNLLVTIIDRESRVLSHHIDEEGSRFIEQKLLDTGISFLPNQTVTAIKEKQGIVSELILESGRTIRTDLVICATGLKPNSELAHKAGLQLYKNSIWTGPYLRTSHPHIYAAGDAIVVKDQITGHLVRSCTWPDAMHQGMIAAHNMAGQPKEYPGIATVTSSAFFGVKFAACGNFQKLHKGGRYTVISCKGRDDEHCKMLMKEGVPMGFVLIGKTLPQLGKLRRAVLFKELITTFPAYRLQKTV